VWYVTASFKYWRSSSSNQFVSGHSNAFQTPLWRTFAVCLLVSCNECIVYPKMIYLWLCASVAMSYIFICLCLCPFLGPHPVHSSLSFTGSFQRTSTTVTRTLPVYSPLFSCCFRALLWSIWHIHGRKTGGRKNGKLPFSV
jgi:hypothetical protein